ncbi:MAG: cytochrome c biogenesis CcdA family protein [Gaiellaceae bacterium]
MTSVLFGGTVLASFLAGTVALFAPCCISVMLPAYFASSFATRRALVAMTFVFAAGLALVILPIALGAAALGSFTSAHHLYVYLAGGGLMIVLGLFMIAGGTFSLPMPGMRAKRGRGPVAVLSLGAFSGLASSCCAPVLAGVAALAGVSGSFSAALALGVAYVFGMVFPLFLIALLWDRFDWGASRLLKGRRFEWRLLGRTLSVHSTALASGLILLGMGGVVVAIAFRGNAMPTAGWQVSLSARLQHSAHVVDVWAKTLPGWVTGLALVAVLAALVWYALGQAVRLRERDQERELPDETILPPPPTLPTPKQEQLIER